MHLDTCTRARSLLPPGECRESSRSQVLVCTCYGGRHSQLMIQVCHAACHLRLVRRALCMGNDHVGSAACGRFQRQSKVLANCQVCQRSKEWVLSLASMPSNSRSLDTQAGSTLRLRLAHRRCQCRWLQAPDSETRPGRPLLNHCLSILHSLQAFLNPMRDPFPLTRSITTLLCLHKRFRPLRCHLDIDLSCVSMSAAN